MEVALRRALFVTWVPQEGQILGRGCPRWGLEFRPTVWPRHSHIIKVTYVNLHKKLTSRCAPCMVQNSQSGAQCTTQCPQIPKKWCTRKPGEVQTDIHQTSWWLNIPTYDSWPYKDRPPHPSKVWCLSIHYKMSQHKLLAIEWIYVKMYVQESVCKAYTVLELQVYLSQVLHLFKMSFIDGSPSIFLSLLTSERGSTHSCGLSNGERKPSFYAFSVDLVEIGVVDIQVYHLKFV